MKTLIKNTLCSVLTSKPFSFMGHYVFGYGVPIFMLHRINNNDQDNTGISKQYLRRCLQYLVKNGYTFLSLEDVIIKLRNREKLPPKPVVFTMDDGFADQVEIGAEVFLEYNCPVTIFLISGMLDKQLWPWDDQIAYMFNETTKESLVLKLNDEEFNLRLNSKMNKKHALEIIRNTIKSMPGIDMQSILDYLSEQTSISIPTTPPEEYRPMTWDMAREYEKKGVKFAPHTKSHYILSKLDAMQAETEITHSWERLKSELASPLPVFCYPTGRFCDYGAREIKLLKDAEFIGAVSTFPAQVELSRKTDSYYYSLPRLGLPASFNEFVHDASWLGFIRNKSAYYNNF